MGSIKVQVNTGANMGTICDEIIMAAAAAAPGSSPSAAQVIRDTNGKVVSVIVNLPGVSAAGLATASAAIQGNNGVSKTQPLGVAVINDNFDSLTPGATVFAAGTTAYDGGIVGTNASVILPAGSSVISGAYAAEAVAGASAWMLQPRGTSAASSKLSARFQLSFKQSLNGYGGITKMRWSYTLSFPNAVNSVATTGSVPDFCEIQCVIQGVDDEAASRQATALGPNLQVGNDIDFNFFDTGIANFTGTQVISHTIDFLSGPQVHNVNGTSYVSNTTTGASLPDDIRMYVDYLATTPAPSTSYLANEISPLIIDNLKWEVLS